MEWLIVVVVVLLPLVWYVATYNRFQRVRNHVRESWSGIDVELKRRYDLIPNLVATVKGFAKHEREVLDRVTELRAQAASNQGSPSAQGRDETALAIGLRQLFAVSEGYPELKSDAQFLALQEELALTEDRIAATRRFYNANVRELRVMRDSFPTSLVAGAAGAEDLDYFTLEDDAERVVPRVS